MFYPLSNDCKHDVFDQTFGEGWGPLVLETGRELAVVNYSFPCDTYWIGGSTNIEITVLSSFPYTTPFSIQPVHSQ